MAIHQALHMALTAHGDQKRKLDQGPYVVHPIEVGILLAKYNMPDHIIIAGILHDTLEDTKLNYASLEKSFGKSVADLVNDVTEQDKSLPWKTRKINYLNHLDTVSNETLMIVCADKITNLQSIKRHSDVSSQSIWGEFNAGYHEQKWYYTSVLERLSPISEHPLYNCFRR